MRLLASEDDTMMTMNEKLSRHGQKEPMRVGLMYCYFLFVLGFCIVIFQNVCSTDLESVLYGTLAFFSIPLLPYQPRKLRPAIRSPIFTVPWLKTHLGVMLMFEARSSNNICCLSVAKLGH